MNSEDGRELLQSVDFLSVCGSAGVDERSHLLNLLSQELSMSVRDNEAQLIRAQNSHEVREVKSEQ